MNRVFRLRPLTATWVASLALVGLTVGSAFLPLGAFNGFVNIGCAIAKALLVLFVFMRLDTAGPVTRITAFAAFGLLVVLVSLAWLDFVLRPTG